MTDERDARRAAMERLYRACKATRAPAFHDAVLRRWARMNGVNIGRRGWCGINLCVWIGPRFEVEGRGVKPYTPAARYPFDAHDRAARAQAFRLALADFNRRRKEMESKQ